MSAECLLASFAKELSNHYKEHRYSPGVIVSFLGDRMEWYCSIHAFPGDTIESRTIVAKAHGLDLETAVRRLRLIWKSLQEDGDNGSVLEGEG